MPAGGRTTVCEVVPVKNCDCVEADVKYVIAPAVGVVVYPCIKLVHIIGLIVLSCIDILVYIIDR